MIEIVVGTKNPTKLEAAKLAIAECLDAEYYVEGIGVSSGVSDQPMDDEEMIEGARNRAERVIKLVPNAHFTIGMEGGIRVMREGWFNLGWVCIIEPATQTYGYGTTLAHRIPDQVRHLMEEQNFELSNAVAEVYGTNTIADRDCSGVITGGLLPADRLYSHGLVAAFADLQNAKKQ